MDEKDGRMGLVLANVSMSGGGQEAKIREALVRDDLIDCMIALPTNLFFTVTIPACLWFLTKNKDDGQTRKRNRETLFIDARKIFTKVDRILNEFSLQQIEKIAGTYRSFIGEENYPKYEDIPGFCKVATIDDMEKQRFVLTPGRYVGAEVIEEEDDKTFKEKMVNLTREYLSLTDESKKLDIEVRRSLREIGFKI
jgi:type I restriction enzyme M protein